VAAVLGALLASPLARGQPQAGAGPGPGDGGCYGAGRGMMGPWMGPGMMGPGMMGPGMGYWGGGGVPSNLNLSAADVKTQLERWVAIMGNPRLKAGPVIEKDANTVTADIVTVDKNVVVNRFAVDRHTGWWRPVE
jgi:hypothetical protein